MLQQTLLSKIIVAKESQRFVAQFTVGLIRETGLNLRCRAARSLAPDPDVTGSKHGVENVFFTNEYTKLNDTLTIALCETTLFRIETELKMSIAIYSNKNKIKIPVIRAMPWQGVQGINDTFLCHKFRFIVI